jgi:hypothetical protein
MGLDSLLERLARAPAVVTPVTAGAGADVTPRPALDKAVTAVTAVTAPERRAEDEPVACRWLVEGSAGTVLPVSFMPAASRAEVLGRYPGARRLEPAAEPLDRGLPPDLARAFDSCVAAGRCTEDEREILAAMVAVDEVETRSLLERAGDPIGRCARCVHHARPGLADTGYCGVRSDLPHVYGLLHRLPVDQGWGCGRFREFGGWASVD